MTVSRQTGGEVTSGDGRISCGTLGTSCGPATYAWTETAVLTATPDAGNMFSTWAGDCIGRQQVNGAYVCSLDTTSSGADKFVAAVFGEAGRTQHVNFTDPAVHGLEFLNWQAELAGHPLTTEPSFECTYCHGATYGGLGTAPSCNDCHAQNGHPNWLNDCTFCHGTPPPPAPPTVPNANHPTVSTDIKTCTMCHPDTVDANGAIVPGGKHMNGVVDGGHPAGFVAPAVHGREFFASVSTGQGCTRCHGAGYDAPIVTGGLSCNSCHAANGWPVWQTNCSFCHGVRSAATQAGAYDVAAHPTWAAPPDALSQRLDPTHVPVPQRTGAHALHLTGSALAGAFRCGVCHQVPTTVTHISGRDVRAAVAIDAPGGTGPDSAAYDAVSGTCATYCHDPQLLGNRSPAWSSTGLQCDGCHGLPPATNAHTYASTDLRECAGCHPGTVNAADGTINVAGGKHLNGAVDVVGGHDTAFAVPANHGPQFLDYVAGATGALNCKSCHGTSLTYCTNCHSSAASGGWASWQANCTFCHGTKTYVYTSANLSSAAPPDAISQRLTGLEAPDRSGWHARHLGNGGFAPAPPYPCATCHPVPTDVNHISVDRTATVTLTAAGAFPWLGASDLARLPPTLGTYDRASGTCSVYCHGSTMQGGSMNVVNWTSNPDFATMIFSCTACHGSPPLSGQTTIGHTYAAPAPINTRYCGATGCSDHQYHMGALSANGYDSCATCHYGSAQGSYYAGLHANGKADVVFWTNGTKPFTASWDPVARTCLTTCHTKSGANTAQSW